MLVDQPVPVTLTHTEWVYLMGYLEAHRASEDTMAFTDIRNGIARQIRGAS
jgi:hypothetical protein